MMKRLIDLLDKISNRKAPAPKGRPKRADAGGDYRAVSIEPGLLCCAAAAQASKRCYLTHEVPRLPLPECTISKNCSCKFRKSADRRTGDRRMFGTTEMSRWLVNEQSRRRGARRSGER